MIDVYAATGTFASKHQLAQDLAKAVMRWEGVPTIPLFLDNTAAFIYELPPDAISNAAGDSNYVRVQVRKRRKPNASLVVRSAAAARQTRPGAARPNAGARTGDGAPAPGCVAYDQQALRAKLVRLETEIILLHAEGSRPD